MNEIVKRIDELRKNKGLTKKALASKMGVSMSTFNKWCYSETMPSLTNIQSICEALDISVEQFFSSFSNEEIIKSEEKFLDEWRMLTASEKLAVEKVIAAFKDIKAVDND